MSKQNVKLTLREKSFYFFEGLALKKGEETEVDLNTLSPAQLQVLKTYIDSGIILSDHEVLLSAPVEVGKEVELPEENEDKEEVKIEGPVGIQPTVSEANEETEEFNEEEAKEEYNKKTVPDLKRELKKRNIETDKTLKDDIIDVLVEDDKKD